MGNSNNKFGSASSADLLKSQPAGQRKSSKAAAAPPVVVPDPNQRQVTLIVVGAGNRGTVYSNYALDFPNQLKVVAVADPRPAKRAFIKQFHKLDDSQCFDDWRAVVAKPKFADAVVIATPDAQHKAPALAFAALGYHILLEKPMAVSEADCNEIVKAANDAPRAPPAAATATATPTPAATGGSDAKDSKSTETATAAAAPTAMAASASTGVTVTVTDTKSAVPATPAPSLSVSPSPSPIVFGVCHVLRYTPTNRKIRELIASGIIGDVQNIQHTEPVGFYHFAHSYVRGNWRNEAESTFSLLAKSCHDIDLLCYWMGDTSNRCAKLASFGGLNHFRRANKPKPAGNATRCMDCAHESKCAYSAKRIYLDPITKYGHTGWPVHVLTEDVPDIESVTAALKVGPYGRCAYECDNDVCDTQTVIMEFEKGQTATFNMVAFTEKLCQRETKIYGSMGELTCSGGRTIEHFDFATQLARTYTVDRVPTNTRLAGHDGADFYLMHAFVRAVATNDPSLILTGPRESLFSHELVFAAERARRTASVVLTGAPITERKPNTQLPTAATAATATEAKQPPAAAAGESVTRTTTSAAAAPITTASATASSTAAGDAVALAASHAAL